MAGLNDRGQLLLTGAFVLAVALVGLTLVFTSGGYTTTLAGQDSAVERGTDAITLRESVQSDLERALRYANRNHSPYSDRRSAFSRTVPEIGAGVRNHSARHGRLVEVSDATSGLSYQEGYQVELRSDGGFDRLDSNATGNETLVSNSNARNVTFVFSDVPTGTSSFNVSLDSGSREWLMTVETGGGAGGAYTVTVERRSGSYAQTCTRPGTSPDMGVDVSGATVDGTHCPALEAIEFDEANYDIRIDGELNGTEGRLWMTVEGAPPSTGYDRVVYSARVPFRYYSASVDYRTDLYVAPGEIR